MSSMQTARTALAVVVLLGSAAGAGAQTDPPPLPSTTISTSFDVVTPPLRDLTQAHKSREIEDWTRQYHEWKQWFVRWNNRGEPGWFSRPRPRRQPPAPPEWLPTACATGLEDDDALAEACLAWREWSRSDLSVLTAGSLAQARAELERPEKSIWWQHLHVDALWVMTQTGVNALGIAGMHATMPVTKRAQVFIAPGVILMRLPSAGGWRAATDWGFSYRMWDFRMPLANRPSTLHFNAVRVWILGTDSAFLQGDLYLAGFSVSFKRR